MKVVVAGGSGALGRRLCVDLATRGHEVVVLTRRPRGGPHRQVAWDGATVGDWAGELAGSAVVNLAGELVDRRPTAANVELLTRSRVAPTRALADAARRLEQPVPVWIQASTLAIYGDAGEQLLTEESPEADGPPQMAGVARAWEAAAVDVPARRRVVLRTSIVLDRDTPALDRLTGLVRFGLGGRVGTGRQWFSWIHVDDWLRIVRHSLGDPAGPDGAPETVASEAVAPAPVAPEAVAPEAVAPEAVAPDGVLLATAPNPVRNSELMAALRQVLRRPPAPPTPAAAVKLGAVFLRTDPALALTGRRAVPARLTAAGFTFRHPHLAGALADLLG
ncbi:DUF1731 domain-containing protein [Polymorphospora sp. NPDC051019]|uniref:epimerase n=1 Tax=Polymorphospora sp. NPDC051019 TaxID=3155725 RepID=UPI003430B64A